MVKKEKVLWEIMFVIWALGVSVIAVFLAIALSLADFIMKIMGKADAQGDVSRFNYKKGSMYE
jgi:hypothetical protein